MALTKSWAIAICCEGRGDADTKQSLLVKTLRTTIGAGRILIVLSAARSLHSIHVIHCRAVTSQGKTTVEKGLFGLQTTSFVIASKAAIKLFEQS